MCPAQQIVVVESEEGTKFELEIWFSLQNQWHRRRKRPLTLKEKVSLKDPPIKSRIRGSHSIEKRKRFLTDERDKFLYCELAHDAFTTVAIFIVSKKGDEPMACLVVGCSGTQNVGDTSPVEAIDSIGD
jgi:hypothetical protein